MEYDCSSIQGEYCVHFMSRTPTLSEEKFDLMVELTSTSKKVYDSMQKSKPNKSII